MAEKPHIKSGDHSEIDTMRQIMGTIGDTTWRMFVPSVGFTLLGVWLDSVYASKPYFMVAGIIVGFSGAILLVRKQMLAIKKTKEPKQ